MKGKKMRTIKSTIIMLLLFTTVFFSFGCTQDGFPVTVGNTTFKSSPETIAVVSPNIADIVDCIGYDAKVSLISDEVQTEKMDYITRCGSAIDPDINTIVTSQVDVVFADDNISDGVVKSLEDKDIKVVQFHYGNTKDSIKNTYKSVGTILGGEEGGKKGEDAFAKLLSTLDVYKNAVSRDYSENKLIYLSGTSLFTTVIGDSWYNTVLDYCGAKVFSDGKREPVITLNEVAKENPHYLVYDGKTYESIKDRDVLKGVKFLEKNHHTQLDKDILKLQGSTTVENVKAIINMIDKNAVKKAEQSLTSKTSVKNTSENTTATTENTTATTGNTTATQKKTETSATKPENTDKYELQSKYKVNFTDDKIKSMTKGKTNSYIKAMQERFSDLGYLGDEYITGYFGDLTLECIQTFQKNNHMDRTGKVTSELLEKLFSSKAKDIA